MAFEHLTYFALASNGMDARMAFEYRRFWKEHMKEDNAPLNQTADLWYDKNLHGKLNHDGDIVHLSETNLKTYKSISGDLVEGVDFVVDAFTDLQKHFLSARATSMLNTNSGKEDIVNMQAHFGWTSVHTAYNSYLKDMYNVLVSDWFSKNITGRCLQTRSHTIRDLPSYTKAVLELLIENNGRAFLSKSAFICSNFLSPMASGLCIEITKRGQHHSDPDKSTWINDPNFQFYKSSAQNHGFMLDGNAPWRLIADINHPVMQTYMETYGVTAENLFQKYYYQTFRYDIDELKDWFAGSYHAYAQAYPVFALPQTTTVAGLPVTRPRLVSRWKAHEPSDKSITSKEISDFYVAPQGDEYWLELYYFIRLRELGVPLEPTKFNRTVKKIIQVYKHFGLDKAQEYVSMLIKNTRTEFLSKRR